MKVYTVNKKIKRYLRLYRVFTSQFFKIIMQSKVDFVKTSTGFGTAGATAENVKLIYDTVKGVCKIRRA